MGQQEEGEGKRQKEGIQAKVFRTQSTIPQAIIHQQ